MPILIAIPIYNERKYVGGVLDKIRRFHSDLLVIDDGSTDGTSQILGERAAGELHVIHHGRNYGYGQSLIDAFAYADANGYDWVITMDCDEQHEPERIPEFVRQIEADDCDLISGSRYLQPRGDDDLPPGDRRSINATLTARINELFHLGITDAFCGYKAHRVSAMRKLKLTVPGYAFPMQLWPQVWHAGLRLKEIPVRLIYNDPTRHFGGNLDDADNRLRHYLRVLNEEIEALAGGSLNGKVSPLGASQTVSRDAAGGEDRESGGLATVVCEAASGESPSDEGHRPHSRRGCNSRRPGSAEVRAVDPDAVAGAGVLPCLCSEFSE